MIKLRHKRKVYGSQTHFQAHVGKAAKDAVRAAQAHKTIITYEIARKSAERNNIPINALLEFLRSKEKIQF